MVFRCPGLLVRTEPEWLEDVVWILGVADLYAPCLRLPAVAMGCILESRFTDKLEISVVVDGTIENMLSTFFCRRVFEACILIDRKTWQVLVEVVEIGRGRA
jgi:hypothetical protein